MKEKGGKVAEHTQPSSGKKYLDFDTPDPQTELVDSWAIAVSKICRPPTAPPPLSPHSLALSSLSSITILTWYSIMSKVYCLAIQ